MDENFQIVEDEYFILKGKLDAGRFTQEQFDRALKSMMLEHEGRYWNIGAKTGKWHVHDGAGWTEAEPPASIPDAHPGADLQATIQQPGAFREIRRFEEYRYEVQGFKREGGQIEGVAFSADGRRALTLDGLGIRVWDLEKGQGYKAVKAYGNCAALSANGSHVLTGGADKIVRLWDVETGREIRTFKGHDAHVTSVAFSPDGRYAFSCSDDRSIRRWEVESSREDRRFEGHEAAITNIALVSDGDVLASMAGDQTVRSWDVQTGQEYSNMRLELDDKYIEGLARRFAINGDRVLTCSLLQGVPIGVWDLKTKTKVRELIGHTGNVWDVAFSADGELAFTCSGSDYVEENVRAETGLDNVVHVWNVESGNEIARLEGHTGDVLCIAISADGRQALTGSKDKTARLWVL